MLRGRIGADSPKTRNRITWLLVDHHVAGAKDVDAPNRCRWPPVPPARAAIPLHPVAVNQRRVSPTDQRSAHQGFAPECRIAQSAPHIAV